MGVMATPFYIDAGFTETDIANVTKLYGIIMSVVGGFIGGSLVARWGVVKPLIVGAHWSAAQSSLCVAGLWASIRCPDHSAVGTVPAFALRKRP